jgi:ribonuclease T1
MKPTSWKQVFLYLTILAAAYLVIGLANGSISLPDLTSSPAATPQSTQSPSSTSSSSTSGTSSSIQVGPGEISVNDLPPEGRTTLKLIKAGGPFPYSKDDTVFSNYEGLLPKKSSGYYHEYTVITPGSSDRGARRIVAGQNGEYYYTSDHYRSFKLIKE